MVLAEASRNGRERYCFVVALATPPIHGPLAAVQAASFTKTRVWVFAA